MHLAVPEGFKVPIDSNTKLPDFRQVDAKALAELVEYRHDGRFTIGSHSVQAKFEDKFQPRKRAVDHRLLTKGVTEARNIILKSATGEVRAALTLPMSHCCDM